tara:strand:- start:1059 stop:1976 length:918 start_codon:yes stop_codon:yes gene_type:complete
MYLPKYSFEWNNNLYANHMMNQAINNYVPTTWGVFKQSASYAFQDNSFVHANDYLNQLQTNNDVLTKEEWEARGYHKSGATYKEGITDTQAQVMEQTIERDKFYSNYMRNTSMFGVGSIAGMISGSIPDPINYIPFVGWAGRISKVAKLASKMPMLSMSINAMAGQAVFEGVKQTHLKSLGRDINWTGALVDIAIAGTIGFGFGGVGKLSGLRKKLANIDPQTHQDNLVNSLTYGADKQSFDGTRGTGELEVPPTKDTTQPETFVADNTKKHDTDFNQNGEFQQNTAEINKKQQAIKNYNTCKGA